ncbi:hypothetical protein [Nocardioides sp.]|uniref:hypothetical protein n=1 Tax=Nocardioides sp. TaxID=35761 RepID=UPI003513402D
MAPAPTTRSPRTTLRLRAAALLAAGAVAGGVTAASLTADAAGSGSAKPTSSSSSTPTPPKAPADGGPGRHGGPGGPGRGAPGAEDTAALAKALGVTEAKLTAALDAVRDQLKPPTPPTNGTKPTPPTDAERAQREAAFAKALAAELKIDVAKVTDALASVRAAHQAEHRTELEKRLDAAVSADKLTAADKASVLKAFYAGVLGPR